MNHNNHNRFNHRIQNGSRPANNIPDDITQSDAVSPRFRSDLNGQAVQNFCYSCKSEFTTTSVHDLMEHYSQPHDRFSSYCLYCKTGKVHQYKSDAKGIQFYHDCYRSKMNYDKWAASQMIGSEWNQTNPRREINQIIGITQISFSSRLPLRVQRAPAPQQRSICSEFRSSVNCKNKTEHIKLAKNYRFSIILSIIWFKSREARG
jgi:hypothetical protein